MSDTVLVVEDEPFIRWDISHHLMECGFTVLEAANAAEAIAILKSSREVALVFTDVRMPGDMDGLGLARWVMTNRPHLPVMIATGDIGRETAMRELCATRAFVKPYALEEVSAAVREALQARKA